MPLLKGRFTIPLKVLSEADGYANNYYVIDHTGEKFSSKNEYEKRLALYEQPIWTCQCTGAQKLTHEAALESEQNIYKYLQEEFVTCYEKDVLQLVHHSTQPLDNLVDQTWRMLQQQLVVGEPVSLKVKANNQSVTGTVVKLDTAGVEQPKLEDETTLETSGADISGSSKENDAAVNSSPKKWVHPKLLPFKYSIKLDSEDKVINGVPAADITRQHRPPSKELLKFFIRANALRGREGSQANTPWIVSDSLARKYSLQSKFPDLLVSPDKIKELGTKALEESLKTVQLKKRKCPDDGKKKAKKLKLDPKQKTLMLSKPKPPINSPHKSPNGKKSKAFISSDDSSSDDDIALAKIVKKSNFIKAKDDDSDDDICLAQLTKSPSKVNDNISLADLKKRLSAGKQKNIKVDQGNQKKKKKLSETKSEQSPKKVAKSEKKKEENMTVNKLSNGDSKSQKKAMKQMTLFDMKEKTKASKVNSKTTTPVKESKLLTPVKKKNSKTPPTLSGKNSTPAKTTTPAKTAAKTPQKVAKTPQKTTPAKLPPIAARLKAAMADKASMADQKGKLLYQQLVTRCAKELTVQQRKALPVEIKEVVEKRWKKINERQMIEKMSPAEREKYMEKKKEELKQKMSEQMKKRWKEITKRFEDAHIDGSPLPPPKIVTLPEGLPNELFGDVVMVTEFISCYKELLMPEEDKPIYSDYLAKSLVLGVDGFAYLGHVLVILLQTLLQDGTSEGNEELWTALSDFTVNPYTAGELLRLSLAKKNSKGDDNNLEDSEEESEEENTEVNELVEQLETNDLHELPPEGKLRLLCAICSRLLTSNSIQDFMNERQQEASELWKKKIAFLKQKNDERKERLEEKRKGKSVHEKLDESKKTMAVKPEKQMDETENSEGDLASIVKRRRQLVKLAEEKLRKEKEEKLKKDKEEKLRKEKEAEEAKQQLEKEQAEKEFHHGTMTAKLAIRQTSLGTDRNHSRYWLFHADSSPGVYVEKGWAPKEIQWTLKTAEEFSDDSGSDEFGSESDEENQGDEQKKRKRRTKASNRSEKTVPHIGQNLWFVYDNLAEVDEVIKALHVRGVRESRLKTELTKHYESIKHMFSLKRKFEMADYGDGVKNNMLEGFKEELLDFEERLRYSTLGGVFDYNAWQDKLANATSLKECSECLLESQRCVVRKFLKGLFIKTEKKQKLIKDVENEIDVKTEPAENNDSHKEKLNEPKLEEENGNNKDAVAELKGENKWIEAVNNCATWSRLHLLMSLLDSNVKWEKSAENAKCKICRKKGDEEALLLCDDCNQAFHMFCLRPPLFEIPEGEWYCPSCMPAARQRKVREKGGSHQKKQAEEDSEESPEVASRQLRTRVRCDYRQLAGEEDENEDDREKPENIQHETRCALCGGDESLVRCSTCPSVFHLDCHEPPLRHEPRSNWRCMQCVTGVRIKRASTRRTAATKRKRIIDSEDSSSDDDQIEQRPSRSKRSSRGRVVNYRMEDNTSDEEEEDIIPSNSHRKEYSRTKVESLKRKRITQYQSDESVENGYNEPTEMEIVEDVIMKLKKHKHTWPYREPVSAMHVPDYYDIVTNPTDLQSIEQKCLSGQYEDAQQFVDDIILMLDNAELYNKPDSIVGKTVAPLEKYFVGLLNKQLPHCVYRRQIDENMDDSVNTANDSCNTSVDNS